MEYRDMNGICLTAEWLLILEERRENDAFQD